MQYVNGKFFCTEFRSYVYYVCMLLISPVDETTTDIICIKCKRDDSDTPNEIVLCDRCGIGELPTLTHHSSPVHNDCIIE